MLYGAHVSTAGGIDKAIDRASSRWAAMRSRCSPQSPRMWQPTAHADEACARFRELAGPRPTSTTICHAPYLSTWRPRTTRCDEVRRALRAGLRGRRAWAPTRTVSSSTSARTSARISRPASRRAVRRSASARAGGRTTSGSCSRTRPAPAARWDARSRSWPGSSAPRRTRSLVSASTARTASPPASTSATRRLSWTRSGGGRRAIGLDRLRACTSTTRRPRWARTATGTQAWARAARLRARPFLGHPAFQDLPAIVETGRSGGAPKADDINRLRALHRNGLRRARRAGLR